MVPRKAPGPSGPGRHPSTIEQMFGYMLKLTNHMRGISGSGRALG